MAKISDLDWSPHAGGERATVDFPNGYSASVLRGGSFYTLGGTYEIAVLRDGHLDYSTPVTDDVCGYLSKAGANKVLAEIEALPAKSEAA
jgi:hypothetical protein